MADVYATQQVGVADGTQIPDERADGREVGAESRVTIASKPVGTALNINDRLYLGKRPAGMKLVGVKLVSDTSFGTTTIDVGDGTTADKYVDGKTMTAVNVPTAIGPKASTVDDEAGDEQEDLWATILTANVGSAVVASFILEFVGVG